VADSCLGLDRTIGRGADHNQPFFGKQTELDSRLRLWQRGGERKRRMHILGHGLYFIGGRWNEECDRFYISNLDGNKPIQRQGGQSQIACPEGLGVRGRGVVGALIVGETHLKEILAMWGVGTRRGKKNYVSF